MQTLTCFIAQIIHIPHQYVKLQQNLRNGLQETLKKKIQLYIPWRCNFFQTFLSGFLILTTQRFNRPKYPFRIPNTRTNYNIFGFIRFSLLLLPPHAPNSKKQMFHHFQPSPFDIAPSATLLFRPQFPRRNCNDETAQRGQIDEKECEKGPNWIFIAKMSISQNQIRCEEKNIQKARGYCRIQIIHINILFRVEFVS